MVIWRAHGIPPVYHLTTGWSSVPGSETRYDPICGTVKPETVTRPDGLEYCRHCIAREGIEQ